MPASRTVHDAYGTMIVPDHVLWGTHTARSLAFFAIGTQRMPMEVIRALAWIKWAAALANRDLGRIEPGLADAIAAAAMRVAQGGLDDEFPLSAWQTGSGTQSHMNVNEVIATLASRALSSDRVVEVHPNDHVNLGQSSNDVFSSAMHLAVSLLARERLLPALAELRIVLAERALAFASHLKIGRTHLQDALPVTLGQEFGAYAFQVAAGEQRVVSALGELHALAIGGTAVGTGEGTHPDFGRRVSALLADRLGLPLAQSGNLFAAMAGHEPMVAFHATLRPLAVTLTKIAGDLRLMGSGPHAGLGDIQLPRNEAGSSIMPGKANPTQAEALLMVCAQVMGHDVAIAMAASQGQLELNTGKPLIVLDTLDSIRLLSDAMESFARHCVSGIRADAAQLERSLGHSLMLVTALVPHIGHDRAAAIVGHAQANHLPLRAAAIALGAVTAEQFDAWVDPRGMLGAASPSTADRPRARTA